MSEPVATPLNPRPAALARTPARHLHARRWITVGQVLVTLALCAFLIVPMVMSVVAGLTVNYFRGVSSGLTLRWVATVLDTYSASVLTSLYVALATLMLVLLTGVPAGYALARSRTRSSRLIEEMLVLPIALPGLATALGLLAIYGGFGWFRNSLWFIVAGHVVFTLPFMVRSVAAICASIDLRTLEEGAASLGASFSQRFFTVVLPNAWPGILAGALTVVTLSLGEFNLTWMLHTPDTKTLPVGLADAYASMRIEIGSAYTIIFFAITIPLLIGMQLLGIDPGGNLDAQRLQRKRAGRSALAAAAPSAQSQAAEPRPADSWPTDSGTAESWTAESSPADASPAESPERLP
jgi:putative spermidine/putrescine transport system permease protein